MAGFWSTFPPVEAALDRVRRRLRGEIEALPLEFQKELLPYVQREGKSLRAGLVFLAAGEALTTGTQASGLDSVAAAVELLHLATLIHDDVVDQAALRRGEPALHRQIGVQKAVLYGDLLFASCFRILTQDVQTVQAQHLANLVIWMAGAEIQQLNDRFSLPISPRRIRRKTIGKTALLFSLSLYSGALEGGRSADSARWFRRAGYSLGLAFQMQDDLLDWRGTQEKLGKPILEDIRNGIYTEPVAIAWEHQPEPTRQELVAVQQGRLSAQDLRDRWAARGYWQIAEQRIVCSLERAERDLSRALDDQPEALAEWQRLINLLFRRTK